MSSIAWIASWRHRSAFRNTFSSETKRWRPRATAASRRRAFSRSEARRWKMTSRSTIEATVEDRAGEGVIEQSAQVRGVEIALKCANLVADPLRLVPAE